MVYQEVFEISNLREEFWVFDLRPTQLNATFQLQVSIGQVGRKEEARRFALAHGHDLATTWVDHLGRFEEDWRERSRGHLRLKLESIAIQTLNNHMHVYIWHYMTIYIIIYMTILNPPYNRIEWGRSVTGINRIISGPELEQSMKFFTGDGVELLNQQLWKPLAPFSSLNCFWL